MRIALWLTGLAAVAATFFLCLYPFASSGPGIPHLDKVIHFSIYFFHAWYFSQLIEHKSFTAVIFITMGLVIEILQFWMKYGRTFESLDLVANTLGVFLGLLFASWKGTRLLSRLLGEKT